MCRSCFSLIIVVTAFQAISSLRAEPRLGISDAALFPLVSDRASACGRFYLVPNGGTDAVRVFNRNGEAYGVWLPGQVNDARGTLSFDLTGNLLVSQFYVGHVLAIGRDGGVAYTISTGNLNGPMGATIAPGGGLAICSYLTDSIKFYDQGRNYTGDLSAHVSDPQCLAFDRDGNLYVGNRADGAGFVSKFDANRQFIQSFGEGLFLPHPLDIALNSSQVLYVATPGIIWKFRRQGALIGSLAEGGLNPVGLAFDDLGDLWVTNAAAPNVYRFDSQDNFLGVIVLSEVPPLYAAAGIAFDVGTSTDCNGNEHPDLCDVSIGNAADCNRNGLPDDCDLPENDCDADGIPDDCEPDCDQDGVPDLCELLDCPLNQLGCQDCNGNNIPDECDMNSGPTHPPFASIRNPDNGHYYLMTTVPATWSAGASIAAALHGHLATISTADENAWIRATFDPLTPEPGVYIGLNDISIEGQFAWANGESVSYTNWLGGEPNNSNNEDWVELRLSDGKWNDFNGNRFGLVEVVLSNDCNENGMIDECDIAAAKSFDCDADGIPDECEPDADGDGFPDRCDGFADYDHDADVDLDDSWHFAACLTNSGPNQDLELGQCRDRFDSNASTTIDLLDLAVLQRFFTGPK